MLSDIILFAFSFTTFLFFPEEGEEERVTPREVNRDLKQNIRICSRGTRNKNSQTPQSEIETFLVLAVKSIPVAT